MDDFLAVVMVVLACVVVFLFGLTVGQPVLENGLCGCVEAP
jgi:hypothetical protein